MYWGEGEGQEIFSLGGNGGRFVIGWDPFGGLAREEVTMHWKFGRAL